MDTVMDAKWSGAGADPVLRRLADRAEHRCSVPLTPADAARAAAAFRELWPGSAYGPASLVLSDLRFGTAFIGRCVRRCVAQLQAAWPERSRAELADTLDFLAALLAVPEEERVGPGEGYGFMLGEEDEGERPVA